MSDFPYCREVLPVPHWKCLTQPQRTHTRQTQLHLTPGDGQETLVVTSPSTPQLPRPYNGKVTPFSQLTAGTPREHVKSTSCRWVHCYQPKLFTVPVVLPLRLCGDWPCLLEGNQAPGGGAAETGPGFGTSRSLRGGL